jgi:hypothetical protein
MIMAIIQAKSNNIAIIGPPNSKNTCLKKSVKNTELPSVGGHTISNIKLSIPKNMRTRVGISFGINRFVFKHKNNCAIKKASNANATTKASHTVLLIKDINLKKIIIKLLLF